MAFHTAAWLTVLQPQVISIHILCSICRKFAGSIPNGVIGFFHLHNPSHRIMALELTQPLT